MEDIRAGWIIDNTKDKRILPQIINQRVINSIIEDNPSMLKLFLVTDHDIKLQLKYDD
ncbi:MAG: hypothetical protein R2879_00535 [Saprospiraceae bacterium]